jgi:hypothetical protein
MADRRPKKASPDVRSAQSGHAPDRECRWRSDMAGSRPLSRLDADLVAVLSDADKLHWVELEGDWYSNH